MSQYSRPTRKVSRPTARSYCCYDVCCRLNSCVSFAGRNPVGPSMPQCCVPASAFVQIDVWIGVVILSQSSLYTCATTQEERLAAPKRRSISQRVMCAAESRLRKPRSCCFCGLHAFCDWFVHWRSTRLIPRACRGSERRDSPGTSWQRFPYSLAGNPSHRPPYFPCTPQSIATMF